MRHLSTPWEQLQEDSITLLETTAMDTQSSDTDASSLATQSQQLPDAVREALVAKFNESLESNWNLVQKRRKGNRASPYDTVDRP